MNKVCSALLAFFDASVIGGNSTKSVAWSYLCVDQNNNFGLLCFWQYLILTKRFVVIEQKFPKVGDTFLDSDRDFAKIETAVRKRENIYAVDEH